MDNNDATVDSTCTPYVFAGSSRQLTVAPPSQIVTRSQNGIFKPKAYVAVTREPVSVQSALQQDNWRQAMIDEYEALQRKKTWSLVSLPQGRAAIGCKWVFKVKGNPNGSVNMYKARLVAKCFNQNAGFDFIETFSPVV